MKRTMSIVVITFFILLIWASVKDSTKVKLYEGIDVNNVTIVGIRTPFSYLKIDDKSKIVEIVNDLKELTFYKSTNINASDDTPNAIIILEGENEIVIDKVIIYGNSVAHIGDKNDYEIKHSDLDKLFKKYKID